MAKFDLKAFNANRAANGNDAATFVMAIDDSTVILAWHDAGTYNGRAYDKYRIGQWYWSQRNGAWQQGNGSMSVPYAMRQALHEALSLVPSVEHDRGARAANTARARDETTAKPKAPRKRKANGAAHTEA